MAQDSKFGTFGGVFTPSILTILGVIMYLRLPWVVGNAGLYMALGIVAVAHVVSVATGLSISSIATDKKVGAGGPYYIVSRSLGLPIGGTLGVALFVGLAFSISLYVIGFSESFLSYWGFQVDATTIRICGSATLVLLTVVTLISTALAIKTQYLILLLIALSLVSVFAGSPDVPALASLQPAAAGPSGAVLFGIFFPAVTGFTAGVNMSGDLRDPKRSLPVGTILAILAGMAVYVSLVVFLAYRVPREALVSDSNVLLRISYSAPAVVAGIWGATLSSALGSILGAPRILQALSQDRITPRWFAKGSGPTNEPRNALLVAFALGEAGVLIAELDAIARIVSMVFLTTYGFLNLSCAIESWVSPDFRPSFKIPRLVSVVGAATCLLLMIQLDLLAMAGSTVLMAVLFAVLSRKQLTLDAGDAWEGIWSTLVRSGLWRLGREQRAQRNWRPNILVFRPPDQEVRERLREVASTFVSGNGIVTDIELDDDEAGEANGGDERPLGVFSERMAAGDVYQTIANVCRYHGFSGLRPNTVLLDWRAFREDAERFGELCDTITQLDHNILLFARGAAAHDQRNEEPESETGDGEPPTSRGRAAARRGSSRDRRVDVWWSTEAGSASLTTLLIRFVTQSRAYRGASVRFLILTGDSANNDHLRAAMRGQLSEARVDASIRIINDVLRASTLYDHVERESHDAALTVMGLPIDMDECRPAYQARIDAMLDVLGDVLFVRASSAFEEVLRLSRQATISFLPPAADGKLAEIPVLELPETPEIAAEASALADAYQRLVSRFHATCVQRVYGREIKLARRLRKVVDKHFSTLAKGAPGANPRSLHKLVNRVQSALVKDFERLLAAFADKGLEAQRGSLEERIRAVLRDRAALGDDDQTLSVTRPAAELLPSRGDTPALAALKRRKRFWARLLRRPTRIAVPIGRLKAFYFERCIEDLLVPTVRQFVTDSHSGLVNLGKTLTSPKLGSSFARALAETSPNEIGAIVAAQKAELTSRLDRLIDHDKERIGRHQWALLAESRRFVQRFVEDAVRLDVGALTRRERKLNKKAAAAARGTLEALPGQWHKNQRLIVERARLGLALSTFQQRFATIVESDKEAIELSIKNGALGECEEVLAVLRRLERELSQQAKRGDDDPVVTFTLDFRPDLERRLDVEQVIHNVVSGVADLSNDLPPHFTTLSDAAMQDLEEGREGDAETVEIPVQRLAQFFVETRFVGVVQSALEKVPPLEARALGVAQDAMRLVDFQLHELEASEDSTIELMGTQLAPVVATGIDRLEHVIGELSHALTRVGAAIDEQVKVVLDGTSPYDLSSTAADLHQHIRRHQRERAAAGARSLLLRASERVKNALVRLMYRKSAGLLRARELRGQQRAGGKLVDRMLALVEESTPRPEVLEQVPSYYRLLFTGQASINEAFWVGRERQLADATRAVASFGRGRSGAIVITGERGSGKTSLIQRLATSVLARRPLHRVVAPRDGSTDPEVLASAIAKVVGDSGTAREVVGRLPDDTVLVFDDLELWWERSEDGLCAVEALVSLVEAFGDRILFVIAVSSKAFAFIDHYQPLADDALAVLECTPMPAEALKSICMLRHGSTGLELELDGKSEAQLTEWKLARLFSSHFDRCGGHIGSALRSWIACVRAVRGTTLVLEPPKAPRWELIDELRPSHKALLIQLLLHKALSRERLARIAGPPSGEVMHDVDTLVRMGLISESHQHTLTINPFVQYAVIDRFQRKGLIT